MYVSGNLKTSDYSIGFHPSGKKYSTKEGMDLDSSIRLIKQLPNSSYGCCFLVLFFFFLIKLHLFVSFYKTSICLHSSSQAESNAINVIPLSFCLSLRDIGTEA